MPYNEQDFLNGLAAGLTATAGVYIPPRKELLIICDEGLTFETCPVGGGLRFGFQIDYDVGKNGGRIEGWSYSSSAVFALGWWEVERKGVALWIRGDITGARAIPIYFSSAYTGGPITIVSRFSAVEFAESESGGEWSLDGSRGTIWYNTKSIFGELLSYHDAGHFKW